MITSEQIENLAKLYQIDNFTIMREYLQLLFLSYLYQNKKADKIYFKGGTAIRLLFDSPRFSEDLDFSTTYNKIQIRQIIKEVGKTMRIELPELKILLLYSGNSGLRLRLKYQPLDFKYPLVVRLDFNMVKKAGKITVSPLVTKFPVLIFPLVSHLSEEEIFSEKIEALLNRNKGRDFFDLWFLLEKGIGIDTKKGFSKESLLKKVQNYSLNEVKRDLIPFLPIAQRKIVEILKDRLLVNLKTKL